jgi:hypothetical protein
VLWSLLVLVYSPVYPIGSIVAIVATTRVNSFSSSLARLLVGLAACSERKMPH